MMLNNPSKKSHVTVLVTMLNEKNKYIKMLHLKIDKLNELISHLQTKSKDGSVGKQHAKMNTGESPKH
jgi:hypothetical protein